MADFSANSGLNVVIASEAGTGKEAAGLEEVAHLGVPAHRQCPRAPYRRLSSPFGDLREYIARLVGGQGSRSECRAVAVCWLTFLVGGADLRARPMISGSKPIHMRSSWVSSMSPAARSLGSGRAD